MPIIRRPAANSQKPDRNSASAASAPPRPVMTVPDMKPFRWPSARMMAAAGMAPTATPTLKAVTGAVANDLSGPSR